MIRLVAERLPSLKTWIRRRVGGGGGVWANLMEIGCLIVKINLEADARLFAALLMQNMR